jgi:glycerate kinase
MLRALGLRLLDRDGREIEEGGAALLRLARIEGEVDRGVRGLEIVVASDVRNPLTGPEGASAIFGPQKGASPDDVRVLDRALSHFADVVAAATGSDLRDEPGAGAAGGLGFALRALLGATMRSGAELVLEAAHFDERVAGADLCVTGEGRLDAQSVFGKASVTVARHARRRGVHTVAIVGSLGSGYERALAEGIAALETIATGPVDISALMRGGPALIRAAATRLAQAVQVGRELSTV